MQVILFKNKKYINKENKKYINKRLLGKSSKNILATQSIFGKGSHTSNQRFKVSDLIERSKVKVSTIVDA